MNIRPTWRTACIALSILLASSGALFAQNSQRLIDIDDKAYIYLDSLFLEKGLAVPNRAKPWSIEEMRHELSRFDPSGLSKAGEQVYQYLSAMVSASEPSGLLEGSAGITIVPEIFIHSRLSDSEGYETEAYSWNHGYEARKSFLEIPLQVWLGDSLYAVSEFAIKEEHATIETVNNYLNIILDDPEPRLDLYFPFKAYTSLGGPGWSVRFGRDQLSWGNGTSGNMILSNYSDFYDYVGVSLFGKKFKLSSVYSIFDAFDAKTLQPTVYSALMAHRLDIRITDRLLLGISESVSFGNEEPELIRDLNYLMIFHNWMIPDRSNSLISLELNYTPWIFFELYGQVAMDEFPTGYEEERGGGGGPPIFGYMFGANGAYPLGRSYLRGGLEWAMTSPWLYNRRAAPYYYNVRRYWSLATSHYEYIVKPIGYRYGPDAFVWNLFVSYDIPDGPSLAGSMQYVAKGETTISTEWNPMDGDSSPSGSTPERTVRCSVIGSYDVLRWLEFGLGLSIILNDNTAHVLGAGSKDFEASLYVEASF